MDVPTWIQRFSVFIFWYFTFWNNLRTWRVLDFSLYFWTYLNYNDPNINGCSFIGDILGCNKSAQTHVGHPVHILKHRSPSFLSYPSTLGSLVILLTIYCTRGIVWARGNVNSHLVCLISVQMSVAVFFAAVCNKRYRAIAEQFNRLESQSRLFCQNRTEKSLYGMIYKYYIEYIHDITQVLYLLKSPFKKSKCGSPNVISSFFLVEIQIGIETVEYL